MKVPNFPCISRKERKAEIYLTNETTLSGQLSEKRNFSIVNSVMGFGLKFKIKSMQEELYWPCELTNL